MNNDKRWWENVPQWQTNVIPSSQDHRGASQKRWLFFIVIVAFAAYVIYDDFESLRQDFVAGHYTEMRTLLVLLVPVLFLLQQISRWRRRVRYGDTPLTMTPFPAFLGDRFFGEISIHRQVDAMPFTAELLLMQRREIEHPEQSGGETQTHLIWKMPVEVNPSSTGMGVQLTLEAKIPDDQPGTQPPHQYERYFWRLYVFSQDKSFKRTWDVPIIARNQYP